MAEKEVRKTTTKRAVRRTASKTVPARSTVRKTTATSVRKAPSRVAEAPATRTVRRSPKALFAGIFLFLVLLGVSAVIGFSDKGQLDVASAIALRKQGATTQEEKDALENVPTEQAVNALPNGGLVALDASEVPPPPPSVVSTTTENTASSSDATASSTPSVEGEVGTEPQTETIPPEEVPENDPTLVP